VTDSQRKPTILCISTYEKGQLFLQEVARLGCDLVLPTVDNLKDGDWPRESLSKLITMPEDMTPGQVLNTVSYMARGIRFDRVVALDEFDLDVAALVREHMRLPGMGESDTRFLSRQTGDAGSRAATRRAGYRSSLRSSTTTTFAAFLARCLVRGC
jgi:hypothetical protein